MHAFLPHAHEVDQRSPCQFASHIWMHNNNNNNVNKKIHPGLGNWLLMQQQHKNQSNQSGSESWSSTWLVLTGRDMYIHIVFFSFFGVANTRVTEWAKPWGLSSQQWVPFEFVLPLKNHLNPNVHISSTQVINIICLWW